MVNVCVGDLVHRSRPQHSTTQNYSIWLPFSRRTRFFSDAYSFLFSVYVLAGAALGFILWFVLNISVGDLAHRGRNTLTEIEPDTTPVSNVHTFIFNLSGASLRVNPKIKSDMPPVTKVYTLSF